MKGTPEYRALRDLVLSSTGIDPDAPMDCPSCGAEDCPGRFCPGCGFRLDDAVPIDALAAVFDPPGDDDPSEKQARDARDANELFLSVPRIRRNVEPLTELSEIAAAMERDGIHEPWSDAERSAAREWAKLERHLRGA